jgi:uncharacterized membrane protein YqjE
MIHAGYRALLTAAVEAEGRRARRLRAALITAAAILLIILGFLSGQILYFVTH